MTLQLTIRNQSHIRTVEVNFLIVSAHNGVYNVILGRPSLNKIKAIISMPHLLMKFPTSQRRGQVQVDQQVARQCYIVSLNNNNMG